MALIEMCGIIIDTNVEYNIKPTLQYRELALKKELRELKKEQKQRLEEQIISIELSEEYRAMQNLGESTTAFFADVLLEQRKKRSEKPDFSKYASIDVLDILA